ncbi:unnamed protein product [Urochloa humidicola]
MEQQPRVYPNAAPFNLEPGHGGGGAAAGVYPPLPTHHGPSANQQQQQLGGGAVPHSWMGNDANTLLVVAALITTLTYQLGTNIPGGYWQQDTASVSRGGKPVTYRAGDPIMRDLHRPRYWVFMGASWVGFASSMVMTLSLLPKTHLSVDIIVWLAVLAFLWTVVSLHPDRRARAIRDLCCDGRET